MQTFHTINFATILFSQKTRFYNNSRHVLKLLIKNIIALNTIETPLDKYPQRKI